jgi:hypothetical protein
MSNATIGSKPARSSAMRMIGWLAVASMLAVALLGPSAAPILANHVTPTDPGTGNPDCASLGYSLTFKIDTGDLEEKTYTDADSEVVTDWDGQEITIDNISDDGQTFDWSSTLPVSAVLVKAGNDNHALYTYDPPATGDTGLTHGAGQQGISHVSFCGDAEEPSNPPSEEPSTPPSEEPSTPPSEEPSTPPSGSEEPTQSEEPSPSFSGGVNPITGAPTLPPTDGISAAAQPGSDTWRVLLVVMAALLASIMVLTPNRSSVRR